MIRIGFGTGGELGGAQPPQYFCWGGSDIIEPPQYFGWGSDITEPPYNFGVAQILLSPQIFFFSGGSHIIEPPPICLVGLGYH